MMLNIFTVKINTETVTIVLDTEAAEEEELEVIISCLEGEETSLEKGATVVGGRERG